MPSLRHPLVPFALTLAILGCCAISAISAIMPIPALASSHDDATPSFDLTSVDLPAGLDEARALILAEKPKKAIRAIERLVEGSMPSDDAGLALGLHALARMARGETERARCLWAMGSYLEPRLEDAALEPWPAGAALVREMWTPEGTVPGQSDETITPPRKTEAPSPQLPRHLIPEKGAEPERVVVQAVIDETGLVRSAKVLEASNGEVALSALAAMCRWRFEPARRGGEPIPVYYNLSVVLRSE